MIVRSLETLPAGEAHWSTRTMAAKAGMSHTIVALLWRTFGVNPHRTESFGVSPELQLVDKVRDVVGLQMDPPQHVVAYSCDEDAQIHTPERTQPILPTDSGRPERRTRGWIPNPTLDLPAALNVAAGEVSARFEHRHRAQDFVTFLEHLEAGVDADLAIQVILNTLSAHKMPPVQRWLRRHPRVQFHFIPTYASWLNLVERSVGLLNDKALRRGSHTSLSRLRAAILTCVETQNQRERPFRQTKATDEILEKMRPFGLQVQQEHGQ